MIIAWFLVIGIIAMVVEQNPLQSLTIQLIFILYLHWLLFLQFLQNIGLYFVLCKMFEITKNFHIEFHGVIKGINKVILSILIF